SILFSSLVLLCLLFHIFLPSLLYPLLFFFFFNDTAPTEIYTLSLHDALPISTATPAASISASAATGSPRRPGRTAPPKSPNSIPDRKSTRLNSSHVAISYAVFCLKKKKKKKTKEKNN